MTNKLIASWSRLLIGLVSRFTRHAPRRRRRRAFTLPRRRRRRRREQPEPERPHAHVAVPLERKNGPRARHGPRHSRVKLLVLAVARGDPDVPAADYSRARRRRLYLMIHSVSPSEKKISLGVQLQSQAPVRRAEDGLAARSLRPVPRWRPRQRSQFTARSSSAPQPPGHQRV